MLIVVHGMAPAILVANRINVQDHPPPTVKYVQITHLGTYMAIASVIPIGQEKLVRHTMDPVTYAAQVATALATCIAHTALPMQAGKRQKPLITAYANRIGVQKAHVSGTQACVADGAWKGHGVMGLVIQIAFFVIIQRHLIISITVNALRTGSVRTVRCMWAFAILYASIASVRTLVSVRNASRTPRRIRPVIIVNVTLVGQETNATNGQDNAILPVETVMALKAVIVTSAYRTHIGPRQKSEIAMNFGVVQTVRASSAAAILNVQRLRDVMELVPSHASCATYTHIGTIWDSVFVMSSGVAQTAKYTQAYVMISVMAAQALKKVTASDVSHTLKWTIMCQVCAFASIFGPGPIVLHTQDRVAQNA